MDENNSTPTASGDHVLSPTCPGLAGEGRRGRQLSAVAAGDQHHHKDVQEKLNRVLDGPPDLLPAVGPGQGSIEDQAQSSTWPSLMEGEPQALRPEVLMAVS